jgi:hypothetical protein
VITALFPVVTMSKYASPAAEKVKGELASSGSICVSVEHAEHVISLETDGLTPAMSIRYVPAVGIVKVQDVMLSLVAPNTAMRFPTRAPYTLVVEVIASLVDAVKPESPNSYDVRKSNPVAMVCGTTSKWYQLECKSVSELCVTSPSRYPDPHLIPYRSTYSHE